MKELYKVLKDHKNQHMENLVLSSYRHCYAQEARLGRVRQRECGASDHHQQEV